MLKQKQNVWNVPNVLTMIRLLLVPLICFLVYNDRMIAGLSVFLIASVTDLVDGYIARRYKLVTDFGKLMDPLADKLMVVSLMVVLAVRSIVPIVAVALLMVKEMLMVLGGIFLLKNKDVVVFAKPIGKVAQLITTLGLVLCFFHKAFEGLGVPVHLIVLWAGVVLAMAALWYYAAAFLKVLKKRRGL